MGENFFSRVLPFTSFLVVFALLFNSPLWAKVSILKDGKSTTVETDKGEGAAGTPAHLFHPDPDDPANQFEPGEVLIGNPPPGYARVVTQLGYEILEELQLDDLNMSMAVLGVPRGKTVPQAVRELSQSLPGASVDANHHFSSEARATHARAAMNWKIASASCGRKVKIGMIDSGVDVGHSALKGQNITFRSFHSKGTMPGPMVHGTAVATMLVGKPRWGGLLPGAHLLAASMFETKKNGEKAGSGRALLLSLNWLAKSRVHAVNLSVAGTDNKVLRLAFSKANKIGMVLVAAAGNWGRSDKPAYPAAYKPVLAVTATDSRGKIYSHANQGSYIDFAAPGVKIFTAVPGGSKVMSGTSFASPYITALLASEIAYGGRKRASTLRAALGRNSVDLGVKGKDTVFGYGFVNIKPRCK